MKYELFIYCICTNECLLLVYPALRTNSGAASLPEL